MGEYYELLKAKKMGAGGGGTEEYNAGKTVPQGSTVIIDGATYTVGTGAEIFNNYGDNKVVADYAHAEGRNTTAKGYYSHAEGDYTKALGNSSHAEGEATAANGMCSHTEGEQTIAGSNYQHVEGRYNVADNNGKFAFIIGNGDKEGRSNAFAVDWSGKIYTNNAATGVDVCTDLQSKIDSTHKLSADLVDDSSATHKFATSAQLSQIETNKTNILLKANTSDVNTATTNLQNQINQIEISASAEAVVAPEVAAARVGADGVEYTTLKARIDNSENSIAEIADEITDINRDLYGIKVPGKNKFNPATITSYATIDANGNIETTAANGTVSDYITILPNKTNVVSSYTTAGGSTRVLPSDASIIAFYDADYEFIQRVESGTSTIPNDAAFIRVWISTAYKTALERCMVEFSLTATTYVPYTEHYEDGAIPNIEELKAQLGDKSLLEGIADGSIRKVKIIGDSIVQGVGGTGYNPNNSTSDDYESDIAAEKSAGTWSWDSESGNTYFGDGAVTFVSNNIYYRENSGYCYANKIITYLESKYGITVKNYGTRGLAYHHLFTKHGVCEDGVDRIMIDQLVHDDDDAVICMFGTNDRSDNFSALYAEIQRFVNYMKEKNKKVVLVASIPARLSAEREVS